jgi:hypothetical protein
MQMSTSRCLPFLLAICGSAIPSVAGAQYYPQEGYGVSRRLICIVQPPYNQQRSSCPVARRTFRPGDYCECRLESYGRLVPGTIAVR